MGQILLGLLCGYVAFSEEGAKIRKRVMDNITKAVNENDRREGLDSEQSVPDGSKSSTSGRDVPQ